MKRCIRMRTADFDYDLPPELIAQNPPEHRGDSRMLVLHVPSGECEIHPFSAITDFLNPGDCLAVNNTRVIRARLYALKDTGAKIEIMLLRPQADPSRWSCFLKPGKRAPENTVLKLLHADGSVSGYMVKVISKIPSGECIVEFSGDLPEHIIERCGHVPLPPYIRHQDLPPDAERYQTVYAEKPGAVAAPTAGLHFTREILSSLEAKGVRKAVLTLHVGQGTFKPVTAEIIEEHKMHSEEYVFPEETAELLNETRRNGHRIAAVGTTSLRVLESCVRNDRFFESGSGETDIFIYPPREVLSADILLTNFHLPKSTLLMLVSAFAGVENIRKAYALAIRERMRFFSYGDCMLILKS